MVDGKLVAEAEIGAMLINERARQTGTGSYLAASNRMQGLYPLGKASARILSMRRPSRSTISKRQSP